MTALEQVRLIAWVHGHVQGVGFRWWTRSRALELGLPYVYLGYWVRGSEKMGYKADFTPLEVFDGESWRPLLEEEI